MCVNWWFEVIVGWGGYWWFLLDIVILGKIDDELILVGVFVVKVVRDERVLVEYMIMRFYEEIEDLKDSMLFYNMFDCFRFVIDILWFYK